MLAIRSALLLGLSSFCVVAGIRAQTRHFEPDANRPPIAFLPTIGFIYSIACADLDGDGQLDVVHAGSSPGGGYYVQVVMRRGGAWSETSLPVVSLPFLVPVEVELIDFDRDGDADLLVGASSQYTATTVLDYFRNDGRGAFARVRTTTVPEHSGVTAAAGDLDGDGDPDLVVGLLDRTGGIAEPLVLARHAGSFGFFAEVGTIAPVAAYAPVLLDLDADGDLDLLALDAQRRVIRFDNQNGAFVGGLPVGTSAISMRAADVDGDGDLDVVLQRTDGSFATLANTGGALSLAVLSVTRQPSAATPFQLADVDGDSDPDLLVPGTSRFEVWRNDGNGRFPSGELLPQANAVGQGDFDGDGATDLVLATHAGHTSTLVHGAVGPLQATMDTARVRGPYSVASSIRRVTSLLDVDRDGLLDLDGDDDVDLLRSDEPELLDNLRALVSLDAPFPGGTMRFAAAHNAGFATTSAFVLPVVALQTRATPRRVPGIAGLLQVDLASGSVLSGVVLPTGSGRAEFGFSVPASPTLVGVDLFMQGLLLSSARAGWTPMVRERVLWR